MTTSTSKVLWALRTITAICVRFRYTTFSEYRPNRAVGIRKITRKWKTRKQNVMPSRKKHMNEIDKNEKTYEAHDSQLSSFSEIPVSAPISESTNDKTTMHGTNTYCDVLGMK